MITHEDMQRAARILSDIHDAGLDPTIAPIVQAAFEAYFRASGLDETEIAIFRRLVLD